MKPRKAIYLLAALAFLIYLVSSFSGGGDKAIMATGTVSPEPARSTDVQSMRQPVRITSNSEGAIFISDYAQGLIFELDTELVIKRAFAVAGRPLAVEWGQGKIFVGNESTRRVEVYNRNGKLLYEFAAAIASPTDIAIDNLSNMVFVVDGPERVVKVFDTSGTYIYDIPKAGVPQNIFSNPTGIAVDPSRREVIVSDFGNPLKNIAPSIKVYDYEGIFRFAIAGNAVQSSFLFSRPQGLAIDPAGNFFMVDSMLGKVLVFDRNTKLGIKSFGNFGIGPGELKLPLDVIISSGSGDVYVTNNRNARVEVFRGGGLP